MPSVRSSTTAGTPLRRSSAAEARPAGPAPITTAPPLLIGSRSPVSLSYDGKTPESRALPRFVRGAANPYRAGRDPGRPLTGMPYRRRAAAPGRFRHELVDPDRGEKAFSAAARARLRASLTRRPRGCAGACARLAVHDERALGSARSGAGLGLRAIPLDAISGPSSPTGSRSSDRDFRPARRRARGGRVSGWPNSAARHCRRSRSSRWATPTRSVTAITASPWPAPAARLRSTRSSPPRNPRPGAAPERLRPWSMGALR